MVDSRRTDVTYTIIYFNGGREQGSESFSGKMSEAQAFAEDAVGTGAYDRVEIRDANGVLVWHHPRTVRPAS